MGAGEPVKRAEANPHAARRAEALALALHSRPCHVLLDDKVARLVASTLRLEPHGTLYAVAAAAAGNAVTVEEALNILDRLITSGFRISLELYLKTRMELLDLGKESTHSS